MSYPYQKFVQDGLSHLNFFLGMYNLKVLVLGVETLYHGQ